MPSWRKAAAIAAIVALILVWAAIVASIAPFVGRWPIILQAFFYLAAGLVWILPLKPLLGWAETGRWRDGSGGSH